MAILESLLLDILWPGPIPLPQKVILMAKMVLHLLDPASQYNVTQLAREHGVSRETLYQWGYTAIAVLGMACLPDPPGPKPDRERSASDDAWAKQVQELQQENDQLRFENQRLRAEVARLTTELAHLVEKAIIVLRLSGKVSYRGIQECIRLLFGVHVPHYVIHDTLAQAADTAEAVLPTLLSGVRVKLASIDEVYLREQGRRVYGLLVVDLPSRVVVSLTRATDRTSDTWHAVIDAIPQAQADLQALVSDLALAFPALVRKLGAAWGRAVKHQVCNVHAMRKIYEHAALAWQAYRQAKQRYDKAQKALAENPEDEAALAEYWAARQLRTFHGRMVHYALRLVAQLVDALRQPTRSEAEAALDQVLAQLAALPADYQPLATKLIDFIQRYRDKLLLHYEVADLDWTTNTCEGAFSVLRRFVTVYKAFPTQDSVTRFFALFMLYYNLKPQHYPDGTVMAPLEKAGVAIEGNYLHYLGYETSQDVISYARLAQETVPEAREPASQLSTELDALPAAA